MDARTSLALWLRAGRAQRGISLEEVSRITKIQLRILERLEAGKGDGLPADVFVRGFVRSFAKCVGLDEEEALRRYHQCSNPGTVSPVSAHTAANPAARAVVEAMADLAPATASATRPRAPTSPLAAGIAPDMPVADETRTSASLPVEPIPAPTTPASPTAIEPSSARTTQTLPVVVEPIPARTTQPVPARAATSVHPARVSSSQAAEPVAAPIVVMLPETGTLTPGELAVADAPAAAAVVVPVAAEQPASVGVEVAPVAEVAPAVDAPIVVSAAMADAVAEPAPPVVGKAEPGSKKKNRRHKRAKRNTSRSEMALGTPALASPIVTPGGEAIAAADASPGAAADASGVAADAAPVAEPQRPSVVTISELPAIPLETAAEWTPPLEDVVLPPVEETRDVTIDDPSFEEPIATATWQPRMPTIVAPTVPWRRPTHVASTAPAPLVPSLVIDDADPDGAEQVREERAARSQPRRSFLPPILLDREDRSARQGGLTLAVIILLIAATLTLSYLMRRPSSSGDGVTAIPTAIEHIG